MDGCVKLSVYALAASAVLAGCTAIEIEATDLSELKSEAPSQEVYAALGEPEAKVHRGEFIAEYHQIDQGYIKRYEGDPELGRQLLGLTGGMIIIPVLAAAPFVYGAGYAEAKEKSRAGVVLFKSQNGQIFDSVRTRYLEDEDEDLASLADLYSSAAAGHPEALTLIGAASVFPPKGMAHLCRAAARGDRSAMEILSLGVFRYSFPSKDRYLEALSWFALAHPTATEQLFDLAKDADETAFRTFEIDKPTLPTNIPTSEYLYIPGWMVSRAGLKERFATAFRNLSVQGRMDLRDRLQEAQSTGLSCGSSE